MTNEKQSAVLVQDSMGTIKAVEIGGKTFPVLRAAPVPGKGQMDLMMVLGNVEISFRTEEPAEGNTNGG